MPIRSSRLLAAVALVVAACAPAVAEDAALEIAVTCEDGLPRLCLLPDADAPSVLVAVTLPVGAADDPPDAAGLSHLVEHLVYAAGGADDPLAGFGNASVSTTHTTYHWLVPPERAGEALDRALAVFGPVGASAEIERVERAAIARERDQREAFAEARLARQTVEAMLGGTPLAADPLGPEGGLDAIDRADVDAFVERHYGPERALLTVAGAFDPAEVRTRLAALATGEAASLPERAFDPTPGEPVRLVAVDPNAGAAMRTVSRLVRIEDGAEASALAIATDFLASSLPGSPEMVLVEPSETLRFAGARVARIAPGWRVFETRVVLRPGVPTSVLDEAQAALDALIAGLAETGLPDGATERLAARGADGLLEARHNAIEAAGDLVGWLASGGTLEDWRALPETVRATDPALVARVLARVASPQRTVVADIHPRAE